MNNYEGKSKNELIDILKKKDHKISLYKEKLQFGGLAWQAKSEKSYELLKANNVFLKNINKKNLILNKNQNPNLLIEGENLHVLNALNFSHKESVDIIYIDPPYNIGSKSKPDFFYDDKRVDEDDLFRHSKWISFIYKRLKLARELLKDNGIIFISIDETEIHNLKLLCDEIFGWRNFLSNIKLKVKAPSGLGSGDSFLQDVGEYILIYSKQEKIKNNVPKILEVFIPEIEKNHTNILKDFRKKVLFNTVESTKGKIKIFKHEFKKEIITKENKNIKFYLKNLENIFRTSTAKGGFMKPMLSKIPSKGLYSFEHKHTKGEKKGQIVTEYIFNGGSVLWFRDYVKINKNEIKRFSGNSNFWLKNYHQGIASEGNIVFNNGKKPVTLIKDLIKMVPNNENATILDFFAGSGTTGQAVLELNNEDNGKRSFILNTNNEDQGYGRIMDEYCYPRIKEQSKIFKSNLNFYKTQLINKKDNDKDKINIFNELEDLICVKEQTFNKVHTNKKFKLFQNSEKLTGIIFDEEYIDDFKNEVLKYNKKINVYIFSYENVNYFNFFKDNKNINPISFPHTYLYEIEYVNNLIKMDHEDSSVSS